MTNPICWFKTFVLKGAGTERGPEVFFFFFFFKEAVFQLVLLSTNVS